MSHQPVEAIVVGTSAGAVEALSKVLPSFPRDFPVPIIVVVHQPTDKRSVLADLFRQKCHIAVCEVEDKQRIEGGTVYFAPPDYHLLVETCRVFSLSTEEQVNYSRPSIDVLFETASEAFGSSLVGVVLTGANNDGAAGLKCIMDAGGKGVVQHPELAYATAMPQAALNLCPGATRLALEEISEFLQGICKRR